MRRTIHLLILGLTLLAACTSQSQSPAPSATGSQPEASAEPTATAIATETPAASPTPSLEPSPSSGMVAKIDHVECLTGQTVSLHIEIKSEAGIEAYEIWSTWGGGGAINQTLAEPFPTEVDETFEFTHAITDPEPRVHQFGLSVMLVGATDPILTYEIEPDGRCPGH